MTPFCKVTIPPVPLFHGVRLLEIATSGLESMGHVLHQCGFQATHQHRHRPLVLYQQGDITLLVNADATTPGGLYARQHGPSICGIGLATPHAIDTLAVCLSRGGEPAPLGHLFPFPALKAVGGSWLYFVDDLTLNLWHTRDFLSLNPSMKDPSLGITHIDHFAQNFALADQGYWMRWYQDVVGFVPSGAFEIEGNNSGLGIDFLSNTHCRSDGITPSVQLALSTPRGSHSQIQTFLEAFQGPGTQHIAFATATIGDTVRTMIQNGVPFLSTAASYYDGLPSYVLPQERAFLQNLGILLDQICHHSGNADEPPQKLYQIFTEPVIGPAFFEVIQRVGHTGFGENNIRALFRAIEHLESTPT